LRSFLISCVLCSGVLLTAGAPTAVASRTLEVKPLERRDAARPRSRTLAPPTSAIQAEGRRIQAERMRAWRSFKDDIAAPHANRSRFASRRVGWNVPRGVLGMEGLPTENFVDTLRVALIRIDFTQDSLPNLSTGNGRFDLSGPDTTAPPIDRPPHNRTFFQRHLTALSRYYDAQSFHHVLIAGKDGTPGGDVWPREQNSAYSLRDMAYLGPWEFNQNIAGAAISMFRQMLLAADEQSKARGDRIPWNSYDRFILIHAGSDLQSDVRQDTPEDIPSFTLFVTDSDAVVFPDSINRARPIDRAAFIPELNSQDGYYGTINGVLAHECGHNFFGFADLYNIDTGLPVVGFWSLMDSGNQVGSIVVLPDGTELFATGLLPPSIDPWHKFRFMLRDILPVPEVDYGQTMPLQNIERHPDCRRVTLSTDEYLMIENRYQSPDTVRLDQDDSTRVVLGPKSPDRYEYDALAPGSGTLVWHIDESVIPLEFSFPIDTALRATPPNYGVNSNQFLPGVSIIEADGLDDLGDLGSPYLLGAPSDPWFVTNAPFLSDTTVPNLRPHIGTRPHVRLHFIDDPDSTMHFAADRVWQFRPDPSAPGWPVPQDSIFSYPPGGPRLLAVDANGDGLLEVCWAGGSRFKSDSTGLFAVQINGEGLFGPDPRFARLDHRPRPVMAAAPVPPLLKKEGLGSTCFFAASTYTDTLGRGGQVWLVNERGITVPGWPAALPAHVTTPPVITGTFPTFTVYVGCENGRVYALAPDGVVTDSSRLALPGGIAGRLAVIADAPLAAIDPTAAPSARTLLVAAGAANGDVAVFGGPTGLTTANGWPQRVGGAGFAPDFLWIDFGGGQDHAQDCGAGALSIIVHQADMLWGYCARGAALAGWGHSAGDSLVDALGAGDPDGDGFPEVLTQDVHSRIAFWNVTGFPSPGWPKRGTSENFLTLSPPLSIDLTGDGRGEVIALNSSGIIAAFDAAGKVPEGWPLATGISAIGSPVAADLDADGHLEIVAPDAFGNLWAYTLPVAVPAPSATVWTELGGDPGRSSSLRYEATPVAPAPSPGPLVSGSFKAYPNPARRRPISFAYTLTEPSTVEFRIVDTSGHQVASFERHGRQADNLEVWQPGTLPAGLYLARVIFRGTLGEHQEVIPLGILR
jgi:M6 family metalloprotease-like protein